MFGEKDELPVDTRETPKPVGLLGKRASTDLPPMLGEDLHPFLGCPTIGQDAGKRAREFDLVLHVKEEGSFEISPRKKSRGLTPHFLERQKVRQLSCGSSI